MNDLSRNYTGVFALFNRLIRPTTGISLDVCTYNVVIECCIRVNRVSLANVFLAKYLKQEPRRFDPPVFNPLLKGLCWENRISEAAAMVLDKMPKIGCSPDLISFTTLINSTVMDSLCKDGQCKEVRKVFDLMLDRGVKPDVVSFRTLLLGYMDEGTVDDVMNILDIMALNHGAPDHSTYALLVKACVNNRKVDDAICVLKRMKEEGIKPESNAFAAIQKMLLGVEQVDEAIHLPLPRHMRKQMMLEV